MKKPFTIKPWAYDMVGVGLGKAIEIPLKHRWRIVYPPFASAFIYEPAMSLIVFQASIGRREACPLLVSFNSSWRVDAFRTAPLSMSYCHAKNVRAEAAILMCSRIFIN